VSPSIERTFLVEHYRPGTTTADFVAIADRVRATTEEMTRGGASIRVLHSTLVPEDETYFFILAAPDAAVVRETYARAGIGFERIVSALELERPVREEPHAPV